MAPPGSASHDPEPSSGTARDAFLDARGRQQAGDAVAAMALYRLALRHDPACAAAACNLGNLLHAGNALDEAWRCFDTALRHAPGLVPALLGGGDTLRRLGRVQEARVLLRAALAGAPPGTPAAAAAATNLGLIAQEEGDPATAAALHAQALDTQPAFLAARYNLGTACIALGLWPQATAAFDTALAARPHWPAARLARGLALLASGDLTRGLAGYSARWHLPAVARPYPHVPLWNPGHDAPPGLRLLVQGEQGLGDTLQFLRYLPALAARGVRIVLAVQPPLLRLCRTACAGFVEAVLPLGAEVPPVDAQIAVMDLPLAPSASCTMPPPLPLAGIAPARERDRSDPRPRIGLAWAGQPGGTDRRLRLLDGRRSLPPGFLAPILRLDGFRFVSLQQHRDPSAEPPEMAVLEDPMPGVTDIADTAALVAGLDLVIAVDTMVAHLAGAAGTPVWLLNRADSCWRWPRDRDTTPWYPRLRLFAQTRPGDWNGPVAAVRRALMAFHGECCATASPAIA